MPSPGYAGRRTPHRAQARGSRRSEARERANARPDRPGWRADAWYRSSPSRLGSSAPSAGGALGGKALDDRPDQTFQLDAGLAIHVEVAAEGVAHLGLVALASGVFAEHEDAPFAAELVDARAVMAGHGEDQVGLLDQLPRQEPGAVTREIESPLEPHEVGALGRGGAVPRARSRRADVHAVQTLFSERALEQRGGERTAADVAGAHEEDLLDLRHQGARCPAARRSSAIGIAPSRITRGCGAVQSTTVDGGRFPNTPPSSTSSLPASTAVAKSRAIAAAPGAGWLPGTFADVEVSGSPNAATNRTMCGCDVHRTAIPPSGPRSESGSRPPPPGSTMVSGPGQNARASALADSLKARPCASAISRSATSNRNGLPGRRPLRRATASTSGPRAREPRPYTVSVG